MTFNYHLNPSFHFLLNFSLSDMAFHSWFSYTSWQKIFFFKPNFYEMGFMSGNVPWLIHFRVPHLCITLNYFVSVSFMFPLKVSTHSSIAQTFKSFKHTCWWQSSCEESQIFQTLIIFNDSPKASNKDIITEGCPFISMEHNSVEEWYYLSLNQ